MASKKEFAEFVVKQLGDAGTITCRKMFGEYGIYCDGCNRRSLIKQANQALLRFKCDNMGSVAKAPTKENKWRA